MGVLVLGLGLLGACAETMPVKTDATDDDAGFAPTAVRKAATAKRHMVASANPIASRVGLDILRKGGTAVDAAIAMQMVLTLVEPQSSGIGGGGFLMHYGGKTGVIEAYEGRESAPRAVTENLFMNPDGTPMERDRYRVGGISVAVPGTVRLLARAHKRHGRLKWRDLFRPAIEMAEKGFTVSPRLSQSIARDGYLKEYPAARAYFFDAKGQPLAAGTLLKNPDLARTLKDIARNGERAFYRGRLPAMVAKAARDDKRRRGLLRASDISAYRVRKRDALCGPYRTWLICGFGPPTAGGLTTLMTLALLERFPMDRLKPGSAEAVHLIAEATRLANADRFRYVADPDFVTVPITGLLDKGYLERRSELIRSDKAMRKVTFGKIPSLAQKTELFSASEDNESPSTTHLSVVDRDGNAVAMTSSVGGAFGSRIMVAGFMLNNHATDFSPVPRTKSGRPKVNRPGPGKRPRSAQSPTFVFDGAGRLSLAVGSPGGPRIIAYVVKTLIAVLDWKMDIQSAIGLPNHAVRRDRIDLERDTALESIAPKLRALGHKVRLRRLTSGLQGIAVKNGRLTGGADPRREGIALGD